MNARVVNVNDGDQKQIDNLERRVSRIEGWLIGGAFAACGALFLQLVTLAFVAKGH